MRGILVAAIAVILAGCVTTTGGQAPQTFLQGRETHEVGHVSYAGQFLPLLVHVKYPEGPGPFPALVYMGGCNGWDATGSSYMLDQMSWFENRGYAVVMLDSLGSRHVTDTCSIDPKTGKYVDTLDLARDARLAVDWLKFEPRIKADRIGLFGFSAGAGGATRVAYEYPTAYRAVFAIYGWCPPDSEAHTWTHNIQYVAGELDNEVYPERCKLVNKLEDVYPVETIIHLYPGVNHGYMLPQLNGVWVQRGYGKQVYLKYDPQARADTIKRAQDWFDKYLLH